MKTRITELFNIKYPLVLSGMSWISTPELAAAVSNAGGLGILATGVSTPDETRDSIRLTRSLTQKPFAGNVTLYFPGSEVNAQILISEKVPVVNYSLGKGDWICEAVHAYGGKVIATVTTLKHALAAQADGADALLVTGHEAAGHGGEVTSLTLVPGLAEKVKIPIIAAGGFADGRGLVAALSLGADAVAMGTRFMNSNESPVSEIQKSLCNEASVFDTVYSDRIDGLMARVLKSKGSARLIARRTNPIAAMIQSKKITDELGMQWLKLVKDMMGGSKRGQNKNSEVKTDTEKKVKLNSSPSQIKKIRQLMRMALGFEAFKSGTIEGDNQKGVLPLGQVAGIIHDTKSVKTIVDEIIHDAGTVKQELTSKF